MIRTLQGHERYGGNPGRPDMGGLPRPGAMGGGPDRMPGMGNGGMNGLARFPPLVPGALHLCRMWAVLIGNCTVSACLRPSMSLESPAHPQ